MMLDVEVPKRNSKDRSEDLTSSKSNKISRSNPKETWTLHVDGSSNSSRSRARLILSSPEGDVMAYTLRFEFSTTNNEVEYEALIAGLKIARELGVKCLKVFTNLQLLARQARGEYEA